MLLHENGSNYHEVKNRKLTPNEKHKYTHTYACIHTRIYTLVLRTTRAQTVNNGLG